MQSQHTHQQAVTSQIMTSSAPAAGLATAKPETGGGGGFADLGGGGGGVEDAPVAASGNTAAAPTSQRLHRSMHESDSDGDWFSYFSEFREQSRDPALSNSFSHERHVRHKFAGEALLSGKARPPHLFLLVTNCMHPPSNLIS